jgi:hypothetical protein
MGMLFEQEIKLKRRLPGYLATALLTLATALWTFWGIGEMYYEGWWGAWTNRVTYLVLMLICWTFAFISLTWPRIGGCMIIFIGGAFSIWRWALQAQLSALTLDWILGWFPISGIFVLIGLLFFLDGRFRRKQRVANWQPSQLWWRRNLNYLIVFIPSILVAIGVSILFIPIINSRYDDGNRGARLIQGNGVVLIWAPAGPGWSGGIGSSQSAGILLPGANLSWNDIAFYGVPPVGFGNKPGYETRNATDMNMQTTGLCRYLTEDGTTLITEPQSIWRMPTTVEIVRSLVRMGKNAGCTWDGVSLQADCAIQTNKDSPLWDPEASPIYYLSGEEYDGESAWYVPYTGGGLYGVAIAHQWKWAGNSRHGFRCVREP